MESYFNALVIFWAFFVAVMFGISHWEGEVRRRDVPELIRPWWWGLLHWIDIIAAIVMFSAGYWLIEWLRTL